MNFIYNLCQIICTQENTLKAQDYLRSRGIKPEKMRYSCVVSGGDAELFSQFSNLYPKNIFIDSLYIPILDVTNPDMLVGFDIRYLGNNSFRTKFHKFKISPDTLMLYFSKNLNDIKDDEPVIVTESFIDALTIEQLGYTSISPLTALHNLKFCLFLHSISNNIYIMYDNDSTGRKAIQKIMKNVSMSLDIQKCFKPIIYSGKDPNSALLEMGDNYLINILGSQVK